MSPAIRSRTSRGAPGFTLLELIVATAIAALVLAAVVPGTMRFYQSVQYRSAVRDVLSTLADARREALDTGHAQDVEFDPERLQVTLNSHTQQLPDAFHLAVTTAGEVNREQRGVIRFYPEGGSTGGDIELRSPTGRGVHIAVDWLMGTVSQEAFDAD